jgi:hypothetical protein
LIDQFDELRGTDVKFKLVWDMMPLSGRLETNFKPGTSFRLPSEYV